MNFITSIFVQRGNPELQDRVEIFHQDNRVMIVVADGAGGCSGAVEAAEFVICSVRENIAKLTSPENCFRFLYELDAKIQKAPECGETTAVVAVVSRNGIFGANVGDSSAWLFNGDRNVELTRIRKPYLGSGVAVPHQFDHTFSEGTLVVGSDGLWKYASLKSIEAEVRTADPCQLASDLSNFARMRSGAFQDDIAIATCRIGIYSSIHAFTAWTLSPPAHWASVEGIAARLARLFRARRTIAKPPKLNASSGGQDVP